MTDINKLTAELCNVLVDSYGATDCPPSWTPPNEDGLHIDSIDGDWDYTDPACMAVIENVLDISTTREVVMGYLSNRGDQYWKAECPETLGSIGATPMAARIKCVEAYYDDYTIRL